MEFKNAWQPAPTAQQSPEGWVVTDDMDKARSVAFPLLFGLIFIGAGLFIFLGDGSFFGFAFIGVGLFVAFTALRQIAVLRKWKPGGVTFPEWPLQAGRSYTARFSRQTRGAEVASPQLVAELELAEVVRYSVGTDTRTASRVVSTNPLAITGGGYGDQVEATIEIDIPEEGPPSLDLSSNKIEWWLVINVDLTEGTDDESRFKLAVVV